MSLLSEPEKLQRAVGWDKELANDPVERAHLRTYLDFQLASAGLLSPDDHQDPHSMTAFSAGILETLREKNRLLSGHRAQVYVQITTATNSVGVITTVYVAKIQRGHGNLKARVMVL